MKKIILLICMALIICGCGAENKDNVLKELKKDLSNVKSYKISGNMEISNDEEKFTYSLESYYLKDNFYKVILVNQTNNHEQIILKNKEDIYVITPALNKSFKFQSEWPDNSSQAYLLNSLLTDINNTKDVEIQEKDGYVIKTNVNYPNNEELKYQKIYISEHKKIEKVEVYDKNDLIKIKVVFDKVDLKAGLKEKDFKLDNYIKEENKEENKNDKCKTSDSVSCEDVNKKPESNNVEGNLNDDETTSEENNTETANIENIIYPLYIPSNTYLTSSETIETDSGNRYILTFSGEKNFVLIEEVAKLNDEMEIIPVYGEPLMLSESIGALSANSLSWDVQNISYYLASTELTVPDMLTIANSLGNTTLVSNTK